MDATFAVIRIYDRLVVINDACHSVVAIVFILLQRLVFSHACDRYQPPFGVIFVSDGFSGACLRADNLDPLSRKRISPTYRGARRYA